MDLRVQRRQGPRHQAQYSHLLQRPGHACRGQGNRRRRRQHLQLIGRHLPGEAGTDAKQHGVTTGQHAHRRAAPCQQPIEAERAWPGLLRRANAAGQQLQLTRRTDNHLRSQQGPPGRLAQAGIALFTDTHHRQPGCHALSLSVVRPPAGRQVCLPAAREKRA